jgi:hypothetical protein
LRERRRSSKSSSSRTGGALDKFHVHIRCFAAWEFERKRAVIK